MLHDISIMQFMGWVSIPTAKTLGLQLLYGGVGFALLAAVIQRGLKGLNEIANVVSVFSDVLSYLRLYALSLAGAIMADTFNDGRSGSWTLYRIYYYFNRPHRQYRAELHGRRYPWASS